MLITATPATAKDPKNAGVAYQQGLTLLKISIFFDEIRDAEAATQTAIKAAGINEQLLAANPRDANARQTLALTYFQLGKLYFGLVSAASAADRQATWEAARSWYTKSLNLWRMMKDNGV